MSSYKGVPAEALRGLAYFSFACIFFLLATSIVTFWLEKVLRRRYSQFTPNLQDLSISQFGTAVISLHFFLRQINQSKYFLEPIGSFLIICFLLQGANVQCNQYCQKQYQPFAKQLAGVGRARQIAVYGIPFYIDLVVAIILQFAAMIDQLVTLFMVIDAVCSILILYEAVLLTIASLQTLFCASQMNITQSSYLQAIITIAYVASMLVGKISYSAIEIGAAYSSWQYGWFLWAKDLFQEILSVFCAITVLVNCYVVHQKIKFTYNLLNNEELDSDDII